MKPKLAAFSDEELVMELERRRFKVKKVRHVWTCHCGARYVGGDSGNACHADRGQVWCRPCYDGRPNFNSARGALAIPMVHTTEAA